MRFKSGAQDGRQAAMAAAVVYWVWLPETSQLTLEEIAGAFGDEVVESEKLDHDHKENISK